MALDLTKFVDEHFADIRRYSIWSLKGVLSRCVEHSEKDPGKREGIDQTTALEYIDKSLEIIRDLTEKYLLLIGYNKLAEKESKNKIDINIRGYISLDLLDKAKERLSSLTNDEFDYLIPKDFSGLDYRDRFLGRDVWDKFYQTMEDFSALKYGFCGEFLISKGYTKILFY